MSGRQTINLDRRRFTRGMAKAAALPFVSTGPLGLLLTGSAFAGATSGAEAASGAASLSIAPGEEHPHACTYMAFASDKDGIWTEPSEINAGLSWVRSDLIDVAKAIAATEPVFMLVLTEEERTIALDLIGKPSARNRAVHERYQSRKPGSGGIELVLVPEGFNDYWMRDTAPVFARRADALNERVAISFNFNGWGNANSRSRYAPAESNRTKPAHFYQPYENDQKVAGLIAARQGSALEHSTLTLEGGALELDGEGTAILTASSILHVNRNPQLFDVEKKGRTISKAKLKPSAKAEVEAELARLLSVTKTIWLSGTEIFPEIAVDDETDITNGHVDFYAKFIAPGVVAYALDAEDATGERDLTLRHQQHLQGQTDAKGRELTLVPLIAPSTYGAELTDQQKENFAAGYINFYICNGAIILPKFGDDEADEAARAALAPYATGRDIIQVDITAIGSGGGGLHCSTMQVPR